MNIILNVAQLIGLNLMLIIITSGHAPTAYILYICTIILAIGLAYIAKERFTAYRDGTLPIPDGWSMIPYDFPLVSSTVYACTSIIHAVLAYTMLHSIIIPVLIGIVFLVRVRNNKIMKEVLQCLK